jgi:hypothetical protein
VSNASHCTCEIHKILIYSYSKSYLKYVKHIQQITESRRNSRICYTTDTQTEQHSSIHKQAPALTSYKKAAIEGERGQLFQRQ